MTLSIHIDSIRLTPGADVLFKQVDVEGVDIAMKVVKLIHTGVGGIIIQDSDTNDAVDNTIITNSIANNTTNCNATNNNNNTTNISTNIATTSTLNDTNAVQ